MGMTEQIGLFVVLGLAVGYAGGLFGIGGGIILVPVFIYLFPLLGVPEPILMHMALGTSVAMLAPTAVSASIKQYRLGNLELGYFWGWGLAVAAGVCAGLLIVPDVSTRELKLVFAFFLLLAVPYLFLAHQDRGTDGDGPSGVAKWATAFAIGAASILTGTGGSTFTVPALSALGLPIRKAIAMASATAPVVSLIGIVGFIEHGLGVPGRPAYSIGYVDTVVALSMIPTIVIGAPLGVRTGNAMNKQRLQHLFGVLILIIALHVLYMLFR